MATLFGAAVNWMFFFFLQTRTKYWRTLWILTGAFCALRCKRQRAHRVAVWPKSSICLVWWDFPLSVWFLPQLIQRELTPYSPLTRIMKSCSTCPPCYPTRPTTSNRYLESTTVGFPSSLYSLSLLLIISHPRASPATKEATHRERHCYHCVPRTWGPPLHPQKHPLPLPARLCGGARSQPVLWRQLLQVSCKKIEIWMNKKFI